MWTTRDGTSTEKFAWIHRSPVHSMFHSRIPRTSTSLPSWIAEPLVSVLIVITDVLVFVIGLQAWWVTIWDKNQDLGGKQGIWQSRTVRMSTSCRSLVHTVMKLKWCVGIFLDFFRMRLYPRIFGMPVNFLESNFDFFRQRKFLQVTSVQMKNIKQAQSKRNMKDQKMILLILEHKVAQHRNPVWHQWTTILIRDNIIKVISSA